jgi:ABC-type Fe3+-hydroxamate transport system substrate-binding protein
MLDSIERSLPAEDERPSAAMVLFSTQDDSIWGYEINQPGYYAAHTRPLGATDALVDAFPEFESGDTVDYETLVEADPDVLLVLGGMTSYHDLGEIRETLKNDPVAGEISAVRNDRVFTQGTRRQGPLLNLFQLEMTAKQLYPDRFGEWPGYATGEPYPTIPAGERLFDRQRVADVVDGEF